MQKFFKIMLATILTIFTIPFGGITAFAQDGEKVYDDIEDGEYELTAKLLKKGTNEKSAAADFMSDQVTLKIQDGNATITFFIPDNEAMSFEKFELEGKAPLIESGEGPGAGMFEGETVEGNYYTFKVKELKQLFDSIVSYEVPMMGLVHKDVAMDIHLVGLDELPTVEEEELTPEDPEENDKGNSEDTDSENGNESDEDKTPEEDGKEEGSENTEGEESEDKENKLDLSNGTYTFDIEYLRSDNDNPSSMGNYLGDSAFVEVKNGKAELTITVTNKDAVTKLQVAGQDPVEIVEDDNGRYERFSLSDLAKTTDAYVEYQASMGDYVHEGSATFRIVLNEETKEEAEAKDKPGNGLLPTPEKIDLSLDNGYYTADVTHYHAKENKGSAMAGYLGKTVFLEVKDGAVELTVTVDDNESVTLLQVEGKDPIEVVKDGKKNYETFELDGLTTIYNAFTEYQAPFGDSVFEGKADFRIVLDENSVKKASKKDKPGYVAPEEPKEDPKEEPKEDPKEDPKEEAEGDSKGEGDDEKKSLTPDKAYEIMYTILHEDGNTASVADGFFQKPGILLEHDGKTYLQMTVESAEMVQALSNKYGDYILVDEKDGTKTMQLRVPNDLSDMKLDMHIVVPAGAIPGFPGYDEEHGAILTFDKDSKKEITVDGLEVVASGDKANENGPYVEGAQGGNGGGGGAGGTAGNGGTGNNGKTPGKPSFGENGDNDEKPSGKSTDNDDPKNPKTGDTSKVFLYTMLLLGSLVPLGVQLRRRFVKA